MKRALIASLILGVLALGVGLLVSLSDKESDVPVEIPVKQAKPSMTPPHEAEVQEDFASAGAPIALGLEEAQLDKEMEADLKPSKLQIMLRETREMSYDTSGVGLENKRLLEAFKE